MRPSVRTLACVLCLSLSAISALAQAPVKKDLFGLLKNVPPPPATVDEAFSKVTWKLEPSPPVCDADKLFGRIERELEEVEQTYEAQAKSGAGMAPPGMSAEMAQKMQDPEFQKKMKSMTKDEKMKMAMEMSKSMTPGSVVVVKESPAVQAVLEEWHTVSLGTQQAFDATVAAEQELANLREENSRAHERIDAATRDEIGKLPQISSGEMSAPDPAAVKAVRLKGYDRHIKQANEALVKANKAWSASAERTKSRFGAFNQKLVAADYASSSKNFGTLKTLSDGQMILMKEIESLERQSRAAHEEAGRWLALRKQLERQKLE
jgi:hypothetical protein